MPSKRAKLLAPSPALDKEADVAVTYNKSGRPVRKTRRSQENLYVDSTPALSDPESDAVSEHGPDPVDSSDSDTIPVARQRKRKRSPSPPLSDDSSDDENIPQSQSSSAPPTPATQRTAPIQITVKNMIINVPAGHTGPFLLQLDISSQQVKQAKQSLQPAQQSKVTSASRKLRAAQSNRRYQPSATQPSQSLTRSESKTTKYAGFLDLPAELRNDIYERVFISETRLNFGCPRNFTLSAAFLRTCRQVYEEGRTIVYSQNHFVLRRNSNRYGSFWEREWNELGFKAIRKFFKRIGPVNTGHIRYATLLLEDAIPCLNPGLPTQDDRRFVFDDVLVSVLRHLATHGKLEQLDLHFRGRRRVERTDHRFLDYLTTIKADEVDFVSWPPIEDFLGYSVESKQEFVVERMCLETMVRKHKLYD